MREGVREGETDRRNVVSKGRAGERQIYRQGHGNKVIRDPGTAFLPCQTRPLVRTLGRWSALQLCGGGEAGSAAQ